MKKLVLAFVLFGSFSIPTLADHPDGTVAVDVNGLVCDFCARAIEKVFKKQQAVDDINVNLDDKIISIHFKKDQRLDEATIKKLIVDSGYDVTGIRYES